jgi:hypothetical protein
MIQIDNKLVSDEVVQEFFACDLQKCKGECCVAGDSGAPLEAEERTLLEAVYSEVEAFLTPESQAAIALQGKWVGNEQEGFSTPMLPNDGACVYTVFEQGIAFCGIERAHQAGKISWLKPISCHLYPIRVTKRKDFEALNYDRWSICKAACGNGNTRGIRVFEFVKDALVRKYGNDFYEQLAATAAYIKENEK